MADYEELVELGFEGVDKLTDRYHDRVYERIPAAPWKRQKKRQQDAQSPRQRSSRHPDKGYSPRRPATSDSKTEYNDDDDDVEMYAPDRRQSRAYEAESDARYYKNESSYYKGPNAGALVPRGSDDFNKMRGFEASAYEVPVSRGYDDDSTRDHRGRGRPGLQRRGSSWSPTRSPKHHGDAHKPRAQSRGKDREHRIVATVGGAIVGGLAGNQMGKGKKFDTVATIVGAIVGGVGAREVAEQWDDRRRRADEREEAWEDEFDSDRHGGSRDGRQRHSSRRRR